jgi:ubiquitin C-terminal hydrolase
MSSARAATLPRLAFVPAASLHAQLPQSHGRSSSVREPRTLQETHDRLPAITEPPAANALVYQTVSRHGPGFSNVGNTCYANATLQAVLHNPAILHIALHHKHRVHPRAAAHPFCALCALRALAQRVHCSGSVKGSAVVPSMFVDGKNLRQISRSFRQYRQEDAHEFLRGLLDSATRSSLMGCGAPLPSTGDPPLSHIQEMRSVVHSACGGVLQSGVTCHSCGHESVTLEPFLDLSVGTAPTLDRALARFTAPDILDGANMYRCEACRKRVVASKRLSVRTAPNSLTIHLKRFNGFKKDRTNVSYCATLDLAPYMVKPPPHAGAAVYNLVAVLVHDGHGTRSGHYFSYVKGSNGTWCLKNDASSSVVPESRSLHQQAYILFYSRDPPCVPRAPAEAEVGVELCATDARMSAQKERLTSRAASPLASRLAGNKTGPLAGSVPPLAGIPARLVRVSAVVEPPAGEPVAMASESSTDPDCGAQDNDLDLDDDDDDGDDADGVDDDDVDDAASRDGTVRAFIAGGGRVVRKLAQRMLNYVGTGADGEPMVSGLGNAPSATCAERPLPPRMEGKPSGVVFRDRGVTGWTQERSDCADTAERARPLQKRARARDVADADYDRGRPKKVRRARGNRPSGGFSEANPFTAAAAAAAVAAVGL